MERSTTRPAERAPELRAALGLLALAVAGLFLGYCAYTLPLSGGLAVQPSPPAIVVEDNAGKAFSTRGVFRGEQVALDQLPRTLVDAVLAIEDRRFFAHSA